MVDRSVEGSLALNQYDSFSRGFLECGICFDQFKDPKFLPCVHTFCQGCLSDYIQSVCSRQNPRFNCPTCRENIEIPDPNESIDKWANGFKDNFLIKNLLGLVSSASDCIPSLPGRFCYKHPGKSLDFMCVDCDVMICSSCAPTLHRTCLQVITLEEAVAEKRSRIEMFHHSFSSHKARSEAKTVEQTKERDKLEMQYCAEKRKVVDHVAQIVRKIKEEENRALNDLDLAYSKFDNELNAELREHTRQNQFLTRLKDASDELLRGEDLHQVIDQYSALEQYCIKLSSYKEKTSCDIQMRNLQYQPNPCKGLQLGSLKLESLTRQLMLLPISTPPPSPGAPASPASPTSPQTPVQVGNVSPFESLVTGGRNLKLERIISAKVKGDKNQPSIRDAASVAGGVLVVTDGENFCVKSFYTHGKKDMHSKLVLEKKPHGVCNYVGNMVAITVPAAKQVAIVSVSPNLILQTILKTDLKYWGITQVGTDAFAVSTCPGTGPIFINIMDLEGNILKCIHNGTALFANPLYMCTVASGDIMVSDCTVSKVACLRLSGHVLHMCQPGFGHTIKKPVGMADDGKGYVFVADSKPVLVLVDYSGNIRYLLQKTEGLKNPKCVAIGPKGSVFVCNENGKVGVFTVQ
ncbi:E3 ubiquitin-protein ligase TRIM56-like [Haliotis asinina]|uniref:E3 ubiquitin-protein ligase TRIM56-like n=1 Tax=Haliotis asinina TaxID=109174 RepID=UPI003531CDE9